MTKALLWEKKKNKIKCNNCAHYCLLSEGDFGVCKMRKNKDGSLVTYNYGKLTALNIDPIEKKPLYHFLPGTETLSIAAPGCSFACRNCQNWKISQKEAADVDEIFVDPSSIVRAAKEKGLKSISFTYGEPIIFLEYSLEIMKLSQKEGIKNIWVTNGYFSKKGLNAVLPYLDAVNIDLKAADEQSYKELTGARIQPVIDSIEKLRKKVWVEVTTLIIPGLNDSNEDLKKIAQTLFNMDPEIPWHVTAFFANYSWDMKDVPDTSQETLIRAYKIGQEIGLKNVYIGNIVGDRTDTLCSHCSFPVIERNGYKISRKDSAGHCPQCKNKLNLILK